MTGREKQGILLAAFGSGSRQGESTLRLFETRVRERFPGCPVRWAFTSVLMRERLATARKKTDSVGKALRRMAFEGFTRIVVQPLHVVPGVEYLEITAEVERFAAEERAGKGESPTLSIGEPLLSDRGETHCQTSPARSGPSLSGPFGALDRAAGALLASMPADRKPGEAVLWMGHGSRHNSAERYTKLGQAVGDADPLVLVGTINGDVRLEHLLPRLQGVRRAWLLPLLSVVGRHALEDMAGTAPRSWKTRLEAAGIECRPVLRGMIESPAFTDIWLDHLETALRGEHGAPEDVPPLSR